jgi:hypothetical protein
MTTMAPVLLLLKAHVRQYSYTYNGKVITVREHETKVHAAQGHQGALHAYLSAHMAELPPHAQRLAQSVLGRLQAGTASPMDVASAKTLTEHLHSARSKRGEGKAPAKGQGASSPVATAPSSSAQQQGGLSQAAFAAAAPRMAAYWNTGSATGTATQRLVHAARTGNLGLAQSVSMKTPGGQAAQAAVVAALQAQQAQQQPAAAPTPPTATAATPAPTPAAAPSGKPALALAGMTQVAGPGGSNPGGIYKDPASGRDFYVKRVATNDHADNEILAADLYKAAGHGALDMERIDLGGGRYGTASAIIQKRSLSAHDPKDAALMRRSFGVHAWLANWDGVLNDNMAEVGGKATTMDVGGALLFRAQGGPKGAAFGDTVTEFDTLRNANGPNPTAAAVFGKMTPQEIEDSVSDVAKVDDATIKRLVSQSGPGDAKAKADLAAKLIKRRDDLVAQAEKHLGRKLNLAGGAVAGGAQPSAPAAASPASASSPAAATGTHQGLTMAQIVALAPPNGVVQALLTRPGGVVPGGTIHNLITAAQAGNLAGVRQAVAPGGSPASVSFQQAILQAMQGQGGAQQPQPAGAPAAAPPATPAPAPAAATAPQAPATPAAAPAQPTGMTQATFRAAAPRLAAYWNAGSATGTATQRLVHAAQTGNLALAQSVNMTTPGGQQAKAAIVAILQAQQAQQQPVAAAAAPAPSPQPAAPPAPPAPQGTALSSAQVVGIMQQHMPGFAPLAAAGTLGGTLGTLMNHATAGNLAGVQGTQVIQGSGHQAVAQALLAAMTAPTTGTGPATAPAQTASRRVMAAHALPQAQWQAMAQAGGSPKAAGSWPTRSPGANKGGLHHLAHAVRTGNLALAQAATMRTPVGQQIQQAAVAAMQAKAQAQGVSWPGAAAPAAPAPAPAAATAAATTPSPAPAAAATPASPAPAAAASSPQAMSHAALQAIAPNAAVHSTLQRHQQGTGNPASPYGQLVAHALAGNLAGVQAVVPGSPNATQLQANIAAHMQGQPLPHAAYVPPPPGAAPAPSPYSPYSPAPATPPPPPLPVPPPHTGVGGLRAQHITVQNGKFSIPSHPQLEAEMNELLAGKLPKGFKAGPGGTVVDESIGLPVASAMHKFVQHRIAEALGFNATPQVQPKAQVDALVKADSMNEAFRAVGAVTGTSGKRLLDQLRTQSPYFGHGVYGHGTYAARVGTHTRTAAQRDSAGYASSGIPPGAQARLYLPVAQMKVIDINDLRRAKHNPTAGGGALQHVYDTQQHLRSLAAHAGSAAGGGEVAAALMDDATIAMLSGHDMIMIPSGGQSDYVNILNRGAVVVQQENHKE